jgi:alpha-tubulin suppressor-like RCC1 family protein
VQVTGVSSITSLAAGINHSLARRNDGTAWGWGYNSAGELGDGGAALSLVPVQALLP